MTAPGRAVAAFTLAWHARPALLAGYVGTRLVTAGLPVAAAALTKVAVDRVVGGGSVVTAAALLAVTGLLAGVSPPLLRYLQAELGRAIAVRAKHDLYVAVGRFPLLRTLETPAFRDRLRMAEEAGSGGPGQVVDSGLALGQAALTLGGMAVALAVIAPWLPPVLMAAAVPAVIAELRLNRLRAAMAFELSPAERRELFYSELLTNLSAAKEIRLFGTFTLFRRRMLTELGAVSAARSRMDLREFRVQTGLAAVSAGLAGAALVWVLHDAASGRLTAGDVAAVITAVAAVQMALSAAVDNLSLAHHSGLLFDHFRSLVDESERAAGPAAEPATEPAAGTAAPAGARGAAGGIELDDVWFRYGDDQPWVLRGVSVVLPAGQAVALVGENGSGKSTLVKLLCRFYDPTRGSVRWDGVDLRDLPVDELRGRIAAVFQDFMCYELSAAENIALGDTDGAGKLDTAEHRLVGPARRAGVHDALTALPDGYDTMLSRTFVNHDGDDGVLLSGGQWQRLALARALLRGQRDLLILDEPSSGLDARAEHMIHREITAHRAGHTSVLVSHRLSAVRDADRILVLAGGRVVEDGGHDALIAADGPYAELFHLQAAGYRVSS